MPWAKVDDGWWCHPKVGGLDLASRGLWVSALSWSCQQRTALVPPYMLAMIGATADHAAILVAAGLWRVADGGWEIHDWSEYQEKSLTEKRAEAGAKGGQRKAANRGNAGKSVATPKQTPSKPDLLEEANGLAGPSLPGPALPDPSRPNENSGSISGDLPVPAAPDDAEPLPKSIDVEQESRRALRLLGEHETADAPNVGNWRNYAGTVCTAALNDGRADELRASVRDGMTAEQAVAAFYATPDPFARSSVPIREFCEDCHHEGWLPAAGTNTVARCACNPDPARLTGAPT